jgi:two-component system response regulator FixJ
VVHIVDDDDAVRESLMMLLEVNGFEVRDYASTADFAAKVGGQDRGCVILDQHLPVTSGLDFLASDEGRALGIPVIMVTGRGDDALRANAMRAGVVAFLDKPVDANSLITEIVRALEAA